MGKTRDLFKKIRDTKEIFYAKMGSIKDRNGMDLTEAEDIKKRWQEYTEELYNKDLHDPDDHDGVITYLQPDILKCEVKWALGSITMNKASGGDGIPIELIKIPKMMLIIVGFLWLSVTQQQLTDALSTSQNIQQLLKHLHRSVIINPKYTT